MIPKSELKPPTEWVNKWESMRKPTRPSPVNSSTSFTSKDGNVHTIFPKSQAGHGGPSISISTSVNTSPPTYSVGMALISFFITKHIGYKLLPNKLITPSITPKNPPSRMSYPHPYIELLRRPTRCFPD